MENVSTCSPLYFSQYDIIVLNTALSFLFYFHSRKRKKIVEKKNTFPNLNNRKARGYKLQPRKRELQLGHLYIWAHNTHTCTLAGMWYYWELDAIQSCGTKPNQTEFEWSKKLWRKVLHEGPGPAG